MNTRLGEMLDLLNCMAVENGAAELTAHKRKMGIFEALALR